MSLSSHFKQPPCTSLVVRHLPVLLCEFTAGNCRPSHLKDCTTECMCLLLASQCVFLLTKYVTVLKKEELSLKEGYPIVFPVDHNNYINKQTKRNKGENTHLLDSIVLNFLNVRVPQALIRISPQAVAKTASNMTSHFIFFIYSLSSPSPCCLFRSLAWWISLKDLLLNRLEVTNHCAENPARTMGKTLHIPRPKILTLFPFSSSPTLSL